MTRELTITPRRNWGGGGALGCMLGFGALHWLPAPLTEPPHAPGETLFDSNQPSFQFPPTEPALMRPDSAHRPSSIPPPQSYSNFVIPQQQIPPPPPKATATRGKFRHTQRNISAMDAYMREGEQKSQEVDFPNRSSSPGGRNTPPPPPRGSVPPPPRRQTPLAPPPSS